MNLSKLTEFVSQSWKNHIIPTLMDYIRIPNKSPLFDPNWEKHGYMENAVELFFQWAKAHACQGMHAEIIRLPHRTPLIYLDIPGQIKETILLYGHLDKQPEMSGWDSDLDPWKPVLKDGKLYGRGGADDGYALFSALTAIRALEQQSLPHARCVILIEASEESGSPDLPFYVETLKDKIGTPNLVICLDSGCGNYEQLWMTTSLRGLVGGVLNIEILHEGIHSGYGSGIVPSCQRILRELLDRIEDQQTGHILLSDLHVFIPALREKQSRLAGEALGKLVYESLPFVPGAKPDQIDPGELILNRAWRPALSVTGCDGMPSLDNAGNVTLPKLSVKLSMRLPPNCPAEKAAAALKTILEEAPPHHARIHFDTEDLATGWNAPLEAPWLLEAANHASQSVFGKPAMYVGEGWTIPFMGMLGEQFPQTQFLITGVLGPKANAHGPNEFLHLEMAEKLTACISLVLHQHAQTFSNPDYIASLN